VTPALDSMPPAPDPAAQARYDAARADEARRAEEAKQADEEAAQKREAAKEAQANREATAKVAADAAVKAMEKNAPPPVMVVPGVVRTPVATPAPNGPPGAKMQ
jgi:FKBP-type peptidyl-prolyl cis-trans isomerase